MSVQVNDPEGGGGAGYSSNEPAGGGGYSGGGGGGAPNHGNVTGSCRHCGGGGSSMMAQIKSIPQDKTSVMATWLSIDCRDLFGQNRKYPRQTNPSTSRRSK